ncbi:MAG: hypothetical protein ACKUBY_00260 [Candidatus Moraniibacteriota bacterium]|jgi:hypothetical protein
MIDFACVNLVGKEVIVSNGNVSQQCVIELGINSSERVQKHKKCTHPPAFQVRSLESGEVIVLFSEEVARMLSGGEALSMKLSR